MGKCKIDVRLKGKMISVDAYRLSFLGKFWGLMFSRKKKAKILLFDFKNPTRNGIHSFFMFYDFLAVWVDEKNIVIQVDFVKPWTPYLAPKRKFVRLIEIPVNYKNKGLVEKFN